MNYEASKFNPETDEDRPAIGSNIEYKDEEYTITKVECTSQMELIIHKPDKGEFDAVLFREHADRPAVVWIVYCNKKEKEQNA